MGPDRYGRHGRMGMKVPRNSLPLIAAKGPHDRLDARAGILPRHPFLCWVVMKELFPAFWKAIARRRGQTSRTDGKNRQKETHLPSVDTHGDK